MLRWFLPFLGLLFCGLASLTVCKAPNLFTWKLAILAGEYGHILSLVPFLIAVCTLLPAFSVTLVVRLATLALCALALGLFLGPSAQAMTIGKRLPGQLGEAFGAAKLGHSAFSAAGLVAFSPATVAPEVKVFSRPGKTDELSLDFYRAARMESEGSNRSQPCVIVIHGGGWDNGDRTQLPELNGKLARLGYAVAAIDYRLAPNSIWPAQRDDVLEALAYLKNHARDLEIDPTRFVLLGRSAGGQIAEAVAYSSDDSAIVGVIALYAPADLNFAWKYARADDVLDTFLLLKQYLGGEPREFAQSYDQASGYLHVRRTSPPTLLVHGGLDSLVWHRQSERLAARLADEKVPHFFLDLPWATHALDFNLAGPSGQLSVFAIEWFLATVTFKKSP